MTSPLVLTLVTFGWYLREVGSHLVWLQMCANRGYCITSLIMSPLVHLSGLHPNLACCVGAEYNYAILLILLVLLITCGTLIALTVLGYCSHSQLGIQSLWDLEPRSWAVVF